MAFRGETSQIPLTNIVQTLKLNGQDGILTISAGKTRRKLLFLGESIRPIETARDDHELLEHALGKLKIATPAQFRNLLATRGEEPACPGDFLLERHIISPEEVTGKIARQLFESVLDIFGWANAHYEFTLGAETEGLELFDPNGLGQALTFAISKILMEVARRQDEWAMIRRSVPSELDVFEIVPNASIPSAPPPGISNEEMREVIAAVDGERNVRAVVEATTLSSFAVEKVLAHLREAGAVRPLEIDRLRVLADRLRRKFKLLEAGDAYARILQDDPNDLDVRQKLVLSLEKKVDPEILVPHYRAIAEQALARGDHPQAKGALVKLQEIDPDDLEAHIRFALLHAAAKKEKDAVDAVRAFLAAANRKRAFADAARWVPRILEELPCDPMLRQECAELLVLAGQEADAVPLLAGVLRELGPQGDPMRIKRAYEQLKALAPEEAVPFESYGRRATKRRRSPLRRIACLVLAGGGMAAAAWLLVDPMRAYLGLRQARALAAERIAAGDEAGARAALLDARRRFPDRIGEAEVEEEFARLARATGAGSDAEPQGQLVQEGADPAPLMVRAAMSESRGDWKAALALYEELARRNLDRAYQEIVERNRRRLLKAIEEADSLARAAKAAESRGAFEEAWRSYMDLLQRFPHAPIVAGVRVPLSISASPPGTRILVDGNEVGVDDVVVRAIPSQRIRVSATRASFVAEERQVSVCDGPRIEFRLRKEVAWTFDALGPIEGEASVCAGRIFVGSRAGSIFAVNAADGTRAWAFKIEGLGDVTGALRFRGASVYGGSFDQSLYVLRRSDGACMARIRLPEGAAIKTTPSEPSASGIVAVAAADGNVYGIDLGAAAIAWRVPAAGPTPPVLWNGRFLFGDAEGAIHALDADRGRPSWSARLRGAFRHAPVVRGDTCFAGSEAGVVWALDAGEGRPRWERGLGEPISVPLALDPERDRLYAATGDGRLHALEGASGRVLWSVDLGRPITGAPVAWRSRVYIGASDRVAAIDARQGRVVWERPVGGVIHAPLCAADGALYVGCDDHKLYAFSLAEE